MKKKPILELCLIVGIAVIACAVFAAMKVGTDPDKRTAAETETNGSEEKTSSPGGEESPEKSTETPESAETRETVAESKGAAVPDTPIPARQFQDPGFAADSDAFCVLDDSGRIVIAKNEAEAFAPASITKVMTALVVLEHASLNDKVVVREEDILSVDIMSSGVYPSLKSGEVFTVEDLLYALILPSTNAAGSILASFVAGDQKSFADLMNEKLVELGLSHSRFKNPHGLDQEGHYVSAYDMCVILKAACAVPELRKILGASAYMIPATEFTEARWMGMGHRMLNGADPLEGAFAGKPGSSPNAGYSLLTAVERGGKALYICTLHSDTGTQYQDTRNAAETAYALLNGGTYRPEILIHDLRIEKVNGTEVTASFCAENGVTSATLRVFDVAKGGDSAIYVEVPIVSQGKQTAVFTLPAYGTYELQAYVDGPEDQHSVASGRFLCMGSTVGEGMFTWNGQTYYGKDTGFVHTGAAEVPGGFYYANDDGGLARGFVGGRFYAGDDFSIVTGWFVSDHDDYYAGADGRIVTGRAMIGGKIYEFTDYGALVRER